MCIVYIKFPKILGLSFTLLNVIIHWTLQINASHPKGQVTANSCCKIIGPLTSTIFPPQSQFCVIDGSPAIEYFTGAVFPVISIKTLVGQINRTGSKWETIMLTLSHICRVANVLHPSLGRFLIICVYAQEGGHRHTYVCTHTHTHTGIVSKIIPRD